MGPEHQWRDRGLTVLPAAVLMGATFPVAARLWAAGPGGLGRRLRGVYAGNVAGAIVGSLAAGSGWCQSSARTTACFSWGPDALHH
ncbi:MAG: hypothetical protein LC797_00150 [Chloroflexi bacterium]|nr:hypothetical protein [Chloroflexota bacterium]